MNSFSNNDEDDDYADSDFGYTTTVSPLVTFGSSKVEKKCTRFTSILLIALTIALFGQSY